MKTRVAIVLPYFGSGGAENMVSRLAGNLNLDKVDVQVFCVFGKPQNNRLEKAVLDNNVCINYIGKGKGFSVGAIIKLYRQLSNFNPHIIHTHLSACVYCVPWVLTHNVKMLHTIHNMPIFELIAIKRYVMKIMYALKKAVPIAISNEIELLTRDYYNTKNNIELVYNPVDVKRFYRDEKRTNNDFVLLNVGRISEQKNQKLLIDAFVLVKQAITNAKLYILGDGPLKKQLEDYTNSLDLKDVYFFGNVTNVEDFFATADIFVLSSIYEGLPLVVLEAMAARLPIISTNVGGVKDIVTDNGILVANKSKKELYEATLKLYSDKSLKEKMGYASWVNVQKYDVKEIADQYILIYNKYKVEK